jgi:hypothetical protein
LAERRRRDIAFYELALVNIRNRERRDRSCAYIHSNRGRETVNTYLQGRKITIEHDSRPPAMEILRLIRKLRWIGMEDEAEQLQMKIQEATAIGDVITVARETD